MSTTNIQKIMRAALFTPTRSGWGIPILFWGKPGIGKSDIVELVSSSYGWRVGHGCEILSPGERGEGAFGVTPMPDADGYISYPPPRWVEQFAEQRDDKGKTTGGAGFVFLDEINTAPPAIQSPMLGLLQKRRIGGAQLPSGVRMMGAANDVVDAAGGWDLAPPLANRMGHLPWEAPTETEWTEWLMTNVDDVAPSVESPAAVERRVMAGWSPVWARVRGLVSGFIRANPACLHKQPPTGHPDASKAWPSHRSWENATRAMASAVVNGMSEADGDMFAAAFVGSGVIGELVEYRTKADLPDPIDVLDGKVTFKPDFKRLDRTYAVLASTSSVVMSGVAEAGGASKARKDTKVMKRFGALVDLLGATAEGAVDLCWGPAKQIAKTGLHDVSDDSKKLMRRLLPLINAVEAR